MRKSNLLVLIATLLFTVASCNQNQTSTPSNSVSEEVETTPSIPVEEINTLAPKVEPNAVQLYALQKAPYMMEQVLNPLLQPFWHTREVYNETFTIIGQEGEVELLYEPSEIIILQDYL